MIVAAQLKGLARETDGQASVEAAALIPSLLVVVALLVQPVCLLYTRSVMSAAAAEAVRLAATSSSADEVAAFVRRRLKAVPEVGVFHAGGEADWSVSVSGAGTARPKVEIAGHARPLPLTAAIAGAVAGSDGSGVVLKVGEEADARAGWVQGTYSDWVGMWG